MPQVSTRRRGLIHWSIALAIWSLVVLVGTFVLSSTSGNRQNVEGIGMLGQLLSFWPAVIGLALGAGSFERRFKTPGTVWIGIIGNALVAAVWLLLIVVGLTMRN